MVKLSLKSTVTIGGGMNVGVPLDKLGLIGAWMEVDEKVTAGDPKCDTSGRVTMLHIGVQRNPYQCYPCVYTH